MSDPKPHPRRVITPEHEAELRALVHLGAAEMAHRLGLPRTTVWKRCHAIGIHFRNLPPTPPATLRKRWAGLIGPMKERLRADIAR